MLAHNLRVSNAFLTKKMNLTYLLGLVNLQKTQLSDFIVLYLSNQKIKRIYYSRITGDDSVFQYT